MDSSTKPSRGYYALVILAILCVYVFGYGVLRWRKVLVRHRYSSFLNGIDTSVFIDRVGSRHTAPTATNMVIESANGLFMSLRRSEEWYWNSASKGRWW